MTDDELNQFLNLLRREGWEVVEKKDSKLDLGFPVSSRYPNLPEDFMFFLGRVAVCANAADNVWFLCEDHYNGSRESAFVWNEFELQSLDAADDDEHLRKSIKEFWDTHIPFMLSVKSDYAYVGLSVSQANYGAIVSSYEPEYEETVTVCDSFSDFIRLCISILNKETEVPVRLYDFFD